MLIGITKQKIIPYTSKNKRQIMLYSYTKFNKISFQILFTTYSAIVTIQIVF